MAVGGRIGDEDVGAGGSVDLAAVDGEGGAAAGDEVELLVGEDGVLGVRLDDVEAGLLGGLGVGAERPDPELHPHRVPGERVGTGQAIDGVDVDRLCGSYGLGLGHVTRLPGESSI